MHFVAMTPDQVRAATEVFGPPHYLHDRWDVRAEQEHDDGDVVVYANGTPRRVEDRDFFRSTKED